ncbi:MULTISPECIES: hypothetical protein [unclassified Exiguobacterium]|uniref:hypothetical protein n=1 Tax=unclassified Exiguobacterium TaxID=2644629 RepID=UPI001BEA3C62|nr:MULTISPECIES: hypothetical protein [unclassified Exiguobacterium]
MKTHTSKNVERVNEIAGVLLNVPMEKEVYNFMYTDLIAEMKPWIERAARYHYKRFSNFNGVLEDFYGFYYDAIDKVLTGQSFADFDPSKGDFYALVSSEAKGKISDYRKYLNAEMRSRRSEASSLDEMHPTEDDATFADVVSSPEARRIDDLVSSDLYVKELFEAFEAATNDGTRKVTVLKMLMYPNVFDTDDIVQVFGSESYDNSTRQRVRRIRKEFQVFKSQFDS